MDVVNNPLSLGSIQFLSGPLAGTTFPINKTIIMIGREPNNDIVISDPTVSRQHARLLFNGSQWSVEKLSSKNTLAVNKREVQQAVINDHDTISLGSGISFIFISSAGAQSSISPSVSMANRIGQQLGNYRLIRLLGTGGFAEVYLGEHIYLRTLAAIKVQLAHLSSPDKQKFYDEARKIARLIHPNIVRLLEFAVEKNTPFMVMDYASKGTLAMRHPPGTLVELATINSYIKQMADALQYAHDQKIIHRDIKPANMLVGNSNEILLSDFGIAVIAHSNDSQRTEEVIGTWVYAAHELFEGKLLLASDQYALGIVVYEWLCGFPPFQGSLAELYNQHLSVPPPSLRARNPAILPPVEQVVLRALSKDPHQRYASVKEFAQALEQASHVGQPINLVPTIPPVNITLDKTLLPNIVSPPQTFNQITDEQIFQALVSNVNPYAEWGTLFYDDTQKQMWPLIRMEDFNHVIGAYAGSIYRIFGRFSPNWYPTSSTHVNLPRVILVQPNAELTSPSRRLLPGLPKEEPPKKRGRLVERIKSFASSDSSSASPPRLIRNYTFQVQVRLFECDREFVHGYRSYGEDMCIAGLVFRSDYNAQVYYRFCIRDTFCEFATKDSKPIIDGDHDNTSIKPGRSHLLAVVVQEASIHLYLDLRLIAVINDSSLLHDGTVGIIVQDNSINCERGAEFSHAKVWVK